MKLLLALIVPMLCSTLLLAGEFKVNKQQPISQPVGTVDRVLKRTANSVTFQDSAHFARGDFKHGIFQTLINIEPIHYLDSTGAWQRFKFDEVASTVPGYDTAVKVGRFTIDYSTVKPGKIRYTRKNAFMEFDPAFGTDQAGIEFTINSRGLKENIILSVSSPPRLAWGYSYTAILEKEGSKGKGKLKDNSGLIRAELAEFTGRDALNQPVLVTAIYTADSLIVTWPKGYTYPVEIDPTLVDTAIAATSEEYYANNATWATARNVTTGTADVVIGAYKNTTYFIARGFYSFSLTGMSPATIDSARFLIRPSSVTGAGATVYVCAGTFSGARATSWFNDFTGWSASDVDFTPTFWANDSLPVAGVFNYSTLFNATGVAAIDAKWGTDTLRVAVIGAKDVSNTVNEALDYIVELANYPQLSIYYTIPGPSAIIGAVDGSAVKMGAIDGSDIETIGGIP